MELNGTSAVVSGGASGLGEATARVLAAAGVTVVIADLNESRGKQIADEIGGQFARTDVTDEASVQAAVDLAVATGEPLRTGVSCAGIGWAARTVGRDGTPHDLGAYQKVIAVNLIGTFNVMRIAAAAMAKTEPADADGQRGVIINTSSIAGIEGQTGQIAYSASKGGIIGMTVPGARDLAAIGVRVNTICPGIIDTPIYGFREGAEEFKARLVAPVVFPKRMGRADEFGHLVRSLIENDYMNAEVVRFDGGIRFQPKLRPGNVRLLSDSRERDATSQVEDRFDSDFERVTVRPSTATSRLTGAGYECHHGPLKSTCTAWSQKHRVIAASARAEGRPPRGWP